jgi:predicted nuclease with TOPRIM domain
MKMLGPQNTQEELLTAFHHDAQWWTMALGYMENEIGFIERLLNYNRFQEKTPNLFERLQQFKQEMSIIITEIKTLKKEINEYEDRLRGILECEDISCDTYYLENHKDLKNRFEKFFEAFNTFKTSVFNYTASVL